jgi:trans-aconitate methyltransferase
MLAGAARRLGRSAESVRVLDLGAGNGISGEALAARGLSPVVAIDIEPAARAAALRDRPGTYHTYLTADLLALSATEASAVRALTPNALACVGAIGLDHVPPAALPAALELLGGDALLAYTLAARTAATDGAEISNRLDALADDWLIEELARERYRHRLSVTGRPIWWEAVVVRAVRVR